MTDNGRRAGRWPRFLSGMALLFLVLAGCSACAGESGAPAGSGVVPWLNRPLPLYRTPDAKLVHYSTSAPACRAGQLRPRQGREGVGLGNQLAELVFTNVSAKTCLLRGYPTINVRTPSGTRRTLHPIRNGTYFGQMLAADIRPGHHGFLDFATSSACESGGRRPVRYSDLRFTLANGGTVPAPKATIKEVCGLSISQLGLPQHYAAPRAKAGTAGTLQLHLQLPPTVRAGAVLSYIVTLRNRTKETVSLQPCPGYTQSLYASGTVVRRSLALNCDSVREIPAHTKVRYAMRLAVPQRAKLGIAKIGWSLNTPTGPFAGQAVHVATR